MAKKEGVAVVAVVEDRQLERFVRKALAALGLDRNKVRIRADYPRSGTGSGKQYVEQAYQKEIVTFRRKCRENRALLLGSEADQQTVAARAQVLDDKIAAVGAPPRNSDERILYWIPKRHVETWGLHLTGSHVDEDTNYHRAGDSIDWAKAGLGFRGEYLEFRKGNASTLPSLNQGCKETDRLKL